MVVDIKYQECMQRVIDYIEDNLQCNLSNTELAGIAGYSEYHFLRIFKDIVHLTPADYIRKRRITEIVRCMEKMERPISDIAFEYGFNSKENFVRAFKAEHHILPTEYKAWKNSLKLYERMVLEPTNFHVDAKLSVMDSFKLVVYPSDESFAINTIHKTWDYIARVWLPENGYVRSGGYELESYVEESREFSETIYIPIKKEETCNAKIGH